jgi:hypothetical protein
MQNNKEPETAQVHEEVEDTGLIPKVVHEKK